MCHSVHHLPWQIGGFTPILGDTVKAFGLVVALVIAVPLLFFGVGLSLPTQISVTRSIEIDAPPGAVFSLIGDLQQFVRWDPRVELDPDITVNFGHGISGASYGLGASLSWSGNADVGAGTMTIVEFQPNQKIVMALDFADQGGGQTTYTLVEHASGGTHLTWRYDSESKQVAQRYFGLMMDSVLGPQYQRGLESLKALAEALPAVRTEDVSYRIDGVDFKAFLAYPIGSVDLLPGVVLVHDWWGHDTHIRERARQLASMGYAALAMDLYGEGKVAQHPEEAVRLMQQVGAQSLLTVERFDAALSMLEQHHLTDPNRSAAIGYGFGGSVVLNMARMGKNLRGAVSFYGGLGDLAAIAEHAHTPVLVLNGEADPFVPSEHKQAFVAQMHNSQITQQIIDYPAVQHAFSDKNADALGEKFTLPLAYHAEADQDAWQRMSLFLDEVFY